MATSLILGSTESHINAKTRASRDYRIDDLCPCLFIRFIVSELYTNNQYEKFHLDKRKHFPLLL